MLDCMARLNSCVSQWRIQYKICGYNLYCKCGICLAAVGNRIMFCGGDYLVPSSAHGFLNYPLRTSILSSCQCRSLPVPFKVYCLGPVAKLLRPFRTATLIWLWGHQLIDRLFLRGLVVLILAVYLSRKLTSFQINVSDFTVSPSPTWRTSHSHVFVDH